MLSLLGKYDIDAGITYLDNEPLGRVVSVPLYAERYQLITAAGNPLSERDRVSWAVVDALPLNLAETFGFAEPIRAIPIVEPDASRIVGLVAAKREPHTPPMRRHLFEVADAGGEGLKPIVIEAAGAIRRPAPEARKALQGASENEKGRD